MAEKKINWVWKYFSTKSGSSLAQCTRCKEKINITSEKVVQRLRVHLHKHGIIDKGQSIPCKLQTHFTDIGGYIARCTYCKKTFFYISSTGNLYKHLRRCHFEKLTIKTSIKENWVRKWFSVESGSSLVKCTRCNEKFNKKYITPLRAHLYEHGIIDKKFELPLSLRTHFTDLGEYKAQCNYCRNIYPYRYTSNLHQHLKRSHLKKLTTETQHEDSNSGSDTELDRTRAESGVTSYSQMRQETGAPDIYAPSTSRSMDYAINPYAENQSQEPFGLPIQLSEETREGTSGLDDLVHWMGTHSKDAFNITQKLYDDLLGSMSSDIDFYSHRQSQKPPDLFLNSSEQSGEGASALDELSYSVMAAEDAFNLVPQLYDALSTLRSTNYVIDPYAEHQSLEPLGFSVQTYEQMRAQTGDFDEYAPSTSRLTDYIINPCEENQSQEPPGCPVQSSEQTREQTGDFDELSYPVMAAGDVFNFVPQLYDAPSTLRSTNYVTDPFAEHQSQEPPGFSVQLFQQTRAQTGDFDEYAPSNVDQDEWIML